MVEVLLTSTFLELQASYIIFELQFLLAIVYWVYLYTIVNIRNDTGGYPNASHAQRLNRLGSQFSVFYSHGIIYLQMYTGDYS